MKRHRLSAIAEYMSPREIAALLGRSPQYWRLTFDARIATDRAFGYVERGRRYISVEAARAYLHSLTQKPMTLREAFERAVRA